MEHNPSGNSIFHKLEEGFEKIVYMKNETVKAKKKINEKDLDDPELFNHQ